ncbi:helix-turn-helix domain-containing protein [Bacillus sp. JJ1562]|uniref:helix-turn-helix domain-containing protein n=1 Tax=Bacillus sp. JJ1562 TaxID=3122960 RepID=UPI0030027578
MRIQNNYPYDLKKQVVEMFLEGHSASELAKKFEIKNQRRVYDWVEKVRADGYSALNDTRGQKSKGKSKKKKTLEEEFELLKLENEYLKKLLDLKRG